MSSFTSLQIAPHAANGKSRRANKGGEGRVSSEREGGGSSERDGTGGRAAIDVDLTMTRL